VFVVEDLPSEFEIIDDRTGTGADKFSEEFIEGFLWQF
jgi:hypothetical protein